MPAPISTPQSVNHKRGECSVDEMLVDEMLVEI